ncbi:MAG TPA: YgcG family protein [Paenalcaligenes sp.]|nr:YgcG family protein [Paenalcaligenes sp.]
MKSQPLVLPVSWRHVLASLWLAWLALCVAMPVWAQPVPVPPLSDWVTDTTDTFTPAQRQALSAQLQSVESDKGAQIFVLLVPTTGEDTIESYARRVFDEWRPGRQGIDDGVLLVVAKDDRRLRIEVGYGLEGAITDLQSGRIIREYITPRFAVDDYAGGIQAGANALITLVNGEDLPPPAASQQGTVDDEGPLVMLLPLAFMAFLMPAWFAAFAIGVFVFLMFWSLPIAVVAALVAFVISRIGRAFGAGGRSNSGLASRRGSAVGGLGGFSSTGGFGGGGGMGGGMGGGGASGGGGGSGGGGASGSW